MDASRLALQSAVAAAGLFAIMQAFGMPEKFVGVLSAVLVVQPTVGHTLGASMDRVVATLVGSGLGVLCLVLLPGGYGTAITLGVCMLAMNFISGFFPQWRYGVVAAVALALGSENDVLQTATERAVAIGLGAALGTVVTLIVWPDRASRRTSLHGRLALRAIADRLNKAVDSARGRGDEDQSPARREYHSRMESARNAAEGIRIGDREAVQDRLEKIERLYNSVLMVNRVAEETDTATEGSKDLSGSVETIRRCSQEIIEAFAGDEEPPEGHMDTIWSALQTAREAASEAETEPREHVMRNALVFALGELADSLQSLVDDSEARE